MLLGTIVGWGVLSPIAKHLSWALGPIGDWNTGSRGWIMWVSLATLIADCLIKLGWLVIKPLGKYVAAKWSFARLRNIFITTFRQRMLATQRLFKVSHHYSILRISEPLDPAEQSLLPARVDSFGSDSFNRLERKFALDIPILGTRHWIAYLLALCMAATQTAFLHSVPAYATVIAILISLVMQCICRCHPLYTGIMCAKF